MHSPRQGSVTQADIDEALFDNNNETAASSSSSDSEKTVLAVNPRSPSMETFATPRSCISAQTSVVWPAATSPVRSPGPSSSIKSPGSSTHAPSSKSNLIQLPVQQQQQASKSTRSSPETLALHFTKPPGTAIVRLRFGWEELQQILQLGDGAVSHFFFLPISR